MTKLIKVFTSYLNNDKMVFRYATMGITSKIEEIGDGLDTIGIGTERKVSKQEGILIPNKTSVHDIEKWFGLRNDYAY